MVMNKSLFIVFITITVFLSGVDQVYGQKPGTGIVNQPKQKTNTSAQKEKSMTNLQIGAGVMGSVLYLSRNINEDNDALGYTIMANYGGHKMVRFNAQYTKYLPINIAPTWYTIKANTIEANVEILASFKNKKTFLYPFVGLSYNTFKGYFTGDNDYLNLREKYKANSYVSSYWLGLNVGTGMEHTIGPVVIFIDYRMRVGKADGGSGFNIQDVCYSGGLRFKLSVPTLHKIYRGINDKYHWF
jgi:hypothetical protein